MTASPRSKSTEVPEVVQSYSPRITALFQWWLRGYFRKNFDGVRTCLEGMPPRDLQGPLIVYSNHPSWWDPIHFLLLARWALPERRMFGPFDADALEQYGFFKRIGGFGVDSKSRRGAAQFLRTCQGILAQGDATLWITAQGEFSDPRCRPVTLQPGVAHLVRRLDHGYVVPLAVEYPFWNERFPEALSYFGDPIPLKEAPQCSTDDWNRLLCGALEETMDRLALNAGRRDADAFHTVVLGKTGVGGVYDSWRRFAAAATGRSFDASHGGDRR